MNNLLSFVSVVGSAVFGSSKSKRSPNKTGSKPSTKNLASPPPAANIHNHNHYYYPNHQSTPTAGSNGSTPSSDGKSSSLDFMSTAALISGEQESDLHFEDEIDPLGSRDSQGLLFNKTWRARAEAKEELMVKLYNFLFEFSIFN